MQTTPSVSLVVFDPAFSPDERVALAGFLAGFRGATRDAYSLDLRQFVTWCDQHQLRLFSTRRADIEGYARGLEQRGLARATVSRRLCTVAGFYRYAEEEGIIAVSPRFTSVDLAWTTSPTRWAWTETRSAPCWWLPD
jgi:integrase/recombinase XerD